MKVELIYSTKVTVYFDDLFERTMTGTLGEILDEVKLLMRGYNFSKSELVDGFTGEIIAIVKTEVQCFNALNFCPGAPSFCTKKDRNFVHFFS